MSDSSPVLSLPLMQPAQAQKHVTHNEALQRLDVLVQLVLKGVGALVPPPAPAGGDVYALGAAPSGLWSGYGGMLAAYLAGEWQFLAPRPGWQGWDAAGGVLRIWTGSAWEELTSQMALDNLARLGVATTSDTVNRLAVSSPATLLTHAGAGHQVKVNKAGAGDTASLLYQTGFSGRAEMGLAGNDDFAIKVSPDGGAWHLAAAFARASGAAAFQAGLTIGGETAYHRGNVLGAVSQAGGLPTGAVIQRGSNANGEFTRFADGTQICIGAGVEQDVAGAGNATASAATWTFPAAFVGAMPCVTGSPQWSSARWMACGPNNLTTAIYRQVGTAASSTTIPSRLCAIGRWF